MKQGAQARGTWAKNSRKYVSRSWPHKGRRAVDAAAATRSTNIKLKQHTESRSTKVWSPSQNDLDAYKPIREHNCVMSRERRALHTWRSYTSWWKLLQYIRSTTTHLINLDSNVKLAVSLIKLDSNIEPTTAHQQ